jgi:hypothetical protein
MSENHLARLEQELNGLKNQIHQLEQQVKQLTQTQQNNLPTSAQEQFAQEIQNRAQQPDQTIEQFTGR